MIMSIVAIVIGVPVALLMLLRAVTAAGALIGRLAGDDRFHQLSKRRTTNNAHITAYWCFEIDVQRFSTLADEARARFLEWVDTQPWFTLEVAPTTPTFAIGGITVDSAIADTHAAILRTTRRLLDVKLPVQLMALPGQGTIAMTMDHTMVSGLTFARCMAYTLGDPENKAGRAFPVAWYYPVVSELALLWYLGRVVRTIAGWRALPTLPEDAGVSPETVYYDFNVAALKRAAVAEQPTGAPSTLSLIAAHSLGGLLRSMRGRLERPLRVGFSVAFTHSKILHNNVGLIVIDLPTTGADMTLSDLARHITRRVGKEKLQAWHSNNFLKTIPRVPSSSYRSGVDVIFTTYPAPPADLFRPEELNAVRVEVREITYPIYVNCISYLERSFVSLVVNTPVVDLAVLRAEHAEAGDTPADPGHAIAPEDADVYRQHLNL